MAAVGEGGTLPNGAVSAPAAHQLPYALARRRAAEAIPLRGVGVLLVGVAAIARLVRAMGHVDLQAFELDPRVSASEQAILSIFYQRRRPYPLWNKDLRFLHPTSEATPYLAPFCQEISDQRLRRRKLGR
jgi:hypothetical protein